MKSVQDFDHDHVNINPWSSRNSEAADALALTKPLPPDLVLIVFIHGFKGTESTFAGFPERLRHIVAETISNVVVESVIFPAYEVAAVERFADWLATLTVEREVSSGAGRGAGKAKIVLCGHSMGGLVAADTLIGMVTSRPDEGAPLWPKIIACIALDTPYFGLHPFVFKNSATKAFGYVQSARQVASAFDLFSKSSSSSSAKSTQAPAAAITAPPTPASGSSWAKWAVPAAYGVGGLLLSGAAAGAAYYKRDDLGLGYKWATDHMKYVGTLWDEEKLKKRVEKIVEIEKTLGVTFRDFYTLLPAKPPDYSNPRTFIVLPPKNSPLNSYFLFVQNNLAEDEVQAHTGMFEPGTNDGYYGLGLEVAKIVREAVASSRGEITKEFSPDNVRVREDGKTHNTKQA
ncbi:hypothetical protein EW145_g5051 [Phellinidium pouzarii]|uniref:AB hydrolase-1 domain-containing protein n=1 Tax=Phellinidium pouzarii TaxID=167371 RepID=A0A4S4L1X8_9AGAM|nr:hypothetical protein EW145_g5051 [Phellinidium pouzarii]